ncbi:hypothetical protein CK203_102345 [Vitis vinifera]|uniref:RNase H type-1 domain-containing protein n=1 Tax=Vitis vinifera TaxID=29760 RepID=A0A438BRC9_VITVI|nr:hypothetical protein CK203_102345 [Vitis vinifera]
MGNQRRSIPLPFTKGAETCLLCQQALADVETRYSKMELTALALRSAAKSSAPIFKPPSDYPPAPRISEQEWWTLRVDGASRSSGSGVGLLLQSPTGEHLEQPSGWDSPRLTMKQNTRPSCPDWTSPCAIRLQTPIYSDSQLVVRHVQKEYEAKDSRMARYLAKVRSTLQQFTEWTIEKIKRADNGALTPWPKIPLATPLSNQADDQEWTHDIAEYLRTGLYPKILNKRTKSGCKLPVSP